MKKLPLGIQSFEVLRETDCVYVDKTEIIHRIISNGKVYFLSRPRLFGKSLLISTIEALFKGRKELFEGLYIYDKWDWSQQYPVIKIDWTSINHSTPDKMKNSLCGYLRDIAKDYQVAINGENIIDCFCGLIRALRDKTGKHVVVLIDEYDKPMTSHLFDSHLEAIRTAVHDFYQVLKGADGDLQFVFFTGILGFSGTNNLIDITLSNKYPTICGYTQEELESDFSEYIDSAAEYWNVTREKILEYIHSWYDGYTWDGKTSVYNPYSIMKFFYSKRFSNYWFATGTPTFLTDMMQRSNYPDIMLETFDISDEYAFCNPLTIEELPMLFQTGYLTVKQKKLLDGVPRYTLGVPNMEVNEAFLTCLLEAFGEYQNYDVERLRKNMEARIIACDEAGFAQSLEAMVATIPYEINKINESYYYSMMLIWMRLFGFKIHIERYNRRADAVWEQPGVTVVAEVKYHAKKKICSLLREIMKQIRDRRDYNRYTGKVILLGIAFSGKNVGCRMKIISQ